MNILNTNMKLKSKILVLVIIVCGYIFFLVWKSPVFKLGKSDNFDTVRLFNLLVEKNTEAPQKTEESHIRICTQDERRWAIKNICKNKPHKLTNPISFVVDPINKLAYCDIQKAGSGTWNLIMANMSSAKIPANVPNNYTVHGEGFLNHHGLDYRTYKNSSAAMEDLKDFTKFSVIRHPLERLLSGYYDKMVKVKKYINHTNVIKKYRTKTTYNPSLDDPSHPTFTEFVSLITNKNDQLHDDRHWKKIEDVCQFCDIDYDYVLKIETMTQDVSWFIDTVYPKDLIERSHSSGWYYHTFLNKVQKHTKVMVPKRHAEYERLNQTLHDQVVDIFQYGVELFGYTYDKSKYTTACGDFHGGCC